MIINKQWLALVVLLSHAVAFAAAPSAPELSEIELLPRSMRLSYTVVSNTTSQKIALHVHDIKGTVIGAYPINASEKIIVRFPDLSRAMTIFFENGSQYAYKENPRGRYIVIDANMATPRPAQQDQKR